MRTSVTILTSNNPLVASRRLELEYFRTASNHLDGRIHLCASPFLRLR